MSSTWSKKMIRCLNCLTLFHMHIYLFSEIRPMVVFLRAQIYNRIGLIAVVFCQKGERLIKCTVTQVLALKSCFLYMNSATLTAVSFEPRRQRRSY